MAVDVRITRGYASIEADSTAVFFVGLMSTDAESLVPAVFS